MNLLNDRAVAAKLALSKTTVWQLVKDRKLPEPIRFDGKTRWIDTELDAWIAARAAERTQLAPSAPVSPTPNVCAEPPAQSAPRVSSSEVHA